MKNKAKKNSDSEMFQLCFLENLISGDISSTEISSVIDSLIKKRDEVSKKEKAEQKRKAEIEAKRQKQLEIERKEAHIRDVTSMELPMDWSNIFDTDRRTQGVHTDSIPDALVMSLTTLGAVDIEYISSITGQDYKTVICTLKGSIFQNPEKWDECFYQGWETADEYLSGNLIRKLSAAEKASAEYNGFFDENIAAIRKVLPPAVSSKDIYVTLGSPWVPVEVIEDFIRHILKLRRECYPVVYHDELTGSWEIANKSFVIYSAKAGDVYGTSRINTLNILEKSLNMKTVEIYDEQHYKKCSAQTKWKLTDAVKRTLNEDETVLALEKQQNIIKEFQKWVWNDKERKKYLEQIYESRFSCVRNRNYDGSFLEFPNMSKETKLYPYQKNAVARILFSPNTLLAHDVGSGKTYIMIAAGMELRRMGLSKKNMYVVPNNIVGQWKDIFLKMYPDAKLLCVEPKSFALSKREDMLIKMRDEDCDGIIIAYSCFEQIPISRNHTISQLEELKDTISSLTKKRTKNTNALERKRKSVAKALNELYTSLDELSVAVHFDDLGITRLFVDEAHNFKNVKLDTKINKVMGLNKTGSKKCNDMMDKVHMIQKQNNGSGVVLATGTPITNSVSDIFIMQKYLQNGELALLDLQNFDSWVGMFAEKATEFEIDVDTSSYRLATRFAKFHNLPELTSLLSSVADFHRVDTSAGIPDFDGYNDALIGKTPEFECYLADISDRADCVRKGFVSREEDNMLKITTDGRKAALDMRLIDPKLPFTPQSKAARCTENIFDIYHKTYFEKGTQLVFCDTSTPKAGFNLYDEIKGLLLKMGVPEDTVAFIHNADTERKRTALFRKVREGEIRILFGSTFKLGTGVNVQNKLAAMHHLDVPWRPADMTQREGRILRQGNENKKVYIFRYITEGSFDAYSWQLLETKQRFITDILSGSMNERSGQDIDDTVLDYAQVKALAVGNPLIKERVETANELSRYLILQRKTIDARLEAEKELMELPGEISYWQESIRNCTEDCEFYALYRHETGKDVRKMIREQLHEAVSKNILAVSEREFTKYQGFTVILPANMDKKKPFVYLRRMGKYSVELGETEMGMLVRLDNFLDKLPKHLEYQKKKLEELQNKQQALRSQLAHKESFADEIERLKRKLEEIDNELGVNKK